MNKNDMRHMIGRSLAIANITEIQAEAIVKNIANSLFWKYKELKDGGVMIDPPEHPATREARERWVYGTLSYYKDEMKMTQIALKSIPESKHEEFLNLNIDFVLKKYEEKSKK